MKNPLVSTKFYVAVLLLLAIFFLLVGASAIVCLQLTRASPVKITFAGIFFVTIIVLLIGEAIEEATGKNRNNKAPTP